MNTMNTIDRMDRMNTMDINCLIVTKYVDNIDGVHLPLPLGTVLAAPGASRMRSCRR